MKTKKANQGDDKEIVTCPDFDQDCYAITANAATKCFIGDKNTKGVAKGICPIIHKPS